MRRSVYFLVAIRAPRLAIMATLILRHPSLRPQKAGEPSDSLNRNPIEKGRDFGVAPFRVFLFSTLKFRISNQRGCTDKFSIFILALIDFTNQGLIRKDLP